MGGDEAGQQGDDEQGEGHQADRGRIEAPRARDGRLEREVEAKQVDARFTEDSVGSRLDARINQPSNATRV